MIAVVGILALLLLIGLTRSREVARSATCARNLQQIGVALGLYEQASRRLPWVATLDAAGGEAPLAMMLGRLGVEEFVGLDDRTPPPTAMPSGEPRMGRYLPGFVCPADPIATARVFPAPVNYRANTGDRADGRRGPFAPGASASTVEVEAGHGASYTAAFAERLVGTAGGSAQPIRDYRIAPGPIPDAGCPDDPAAPLQADAGRSWLELGWRSTLYTHASPPNAARSCIAVDGRSALIGASSGHVEGVRVLLVDGGVRVYTTTVAPPVWAALGSYRDDEAEDAPPSSRPDAEEAPIALPAPSPSPRGGFGPPPAWTRPDSCGAG